MFSGDLKDGEGAELIRSRLKGYLSESCYLVVDCRTLKRREKKGWRINEVILVSRIEILGTMVVEECVD